VPESSPAAASLRADKRMVPNPSGRGPANRTCRSALECCRQVRQNAGGNSPRLLSLKTIDIACGSDHMLLARLRTGEDEPAPEPLRESIREVISHCTMAWTEMGRETTGRDGAGASAGRAVEDLSGQRPGEQPENGQCTLHRAGADCPGLFRAAIVGR